MPDKRAVISAEEREAWVKRAEAEAKAMRERDPALTAEIARAAERGLVVRDVASEAAERWAELVRRGMSGTSGRCEPWVEPTPEDRVREAEAEARKRARNAEVVRRWRGR